LFEIGDLRASISWLCMLTSTFILLSKPGRPQFFNELLFAYQKACKDMEYDVNGDLYFLGLIEINKEALSFNQVYLFSP